MRNTFKNRNSGYQGFGHAKNFHSTVSSFHEGGFRSFEYLSETIYKLITICLRWARYLLAMEW